ncbi:MAG: hypothetical protein M1814_000066 [Vezdaea aestivalis]|nr:MAG: hypothetical protein M1814_000066 [Vezdaea aestivalis]
MAKGESLGRITALKRAEVQGMTPSSDGALDQLLDLFVRGAEGTYNKNANFDYLAYLFADLAKTSDGQKYFVTERKYDRVVPLTKLIVFTEHGSLIRRKGVASTVKNITFHVPSHRVLLSRTSINVLPYILLPLAGPEELSDEDTEALLPELQLLAPDKERDKDHEILKTHLETLLLFSTTREGREVLRAAGVYPIVREAHLHVTEEGVREAAERLVDLLMRDEEGEGKEGQEGQEGRSRAEEVEDDEDEQIVDVF